MPVSGLVIVCRGDALDVLRTLRSDDRVTLGPLETAGRIPIVLETETNSAHRRCMEWLGHLDGVSHLELAYADYRCGAGEADEATDAARES